MTERELLKECLRVLTARFHDPQMFPSAEEVDLLYKLTQYNYSWFKEKLDG